MDLLKHLYSIHSPSGMEWPIIIYVREYIETHIPEANLKVDGFGNLYITKGQTSDGYPTLVCHLDQVQKLHSDDFISIEAGGIIFGYSESKHRREGLGADDKNGIWVCLKCLEQCPYLKVFMAVMEEKGMFGSKAADMSFFSDSLYVIEPDSPEGCNLKHELREIPCSCPEFIKAIQPETHGFKIIDGKGTDILALKMNGLGVSAINIGAGYYRPHKDDEYTVVSDLQQCLNYILLIINTIYERFPHEYKTETQKWIEEKSMKR